MCEDVRASSPSQMMGTEAQSLYEALDLDAGRVLLEEKRKEETYSLKRVHRLRRHNAGVAGPTDRNTQTDWIESIPAWGRQDEIVSQVDVLRERDSPSGIRINILICSFDW